MPQNPATAHMDFYHAARDYCERQTARLPLGAVGQISQAHPEFAQWERQADDAALRGDMLTCQMHLRQVMRGWRAAAQAMLKDERPVAAAQLTFPD